LKIFYLFSSKVDQIFVYNLRINNSILIKRVNILRIDNFARMATLFDSYTDKYVTPILSSFVFSNN
jgi:hypothetical protein